MVLLRLSFPGWPWRHVLLLQTQLCRHENSTSVISVEADVDWCAMVGLGLRLALVSSMVLSALISILVTLTWVTSKGS